MIIAMIDAKYVKCKVRLTFGHYADGSTAIQGFSLMGEPMFTATAAIDEPAGLDRVWLKGWSENEGIPEALEKAGIVELTGRRAKTGYVDAQEGKLLITICPKCGDNEAEERKSLGIYAGKFCDACWDASGYRKEGPEGFDPMDAGEAYGEDDY